jgi:hypothetical protein
VTLNGSKYLLYTPKHLKTLVMKEMENIGNGEDPNSINPYACIRPCAT